MSVIDGIPAWAEKGTDLPMQAQSTVTMRSWQESALDDADRFMSDLQMLGLQQDEVSHGVELARTGGSGPLARLNDWFSGRKIVVDSRQPADVILPLFVLSAYSTPGCVSTYQTTSDQSHKLGWNVTIFGTGLSGEATISSSVTSTLTAEAGQAVLVFLPITVAVEQVRVVAKDGTTISSGQRIDVSPAQQEHPVPGGRLLDASALPAPGEFVQTYSLAGYPAGSPADYQYVYTQEKSASLRVGLKVSGADISVTGSVSMSTSVTLDFKLAGGRDYRLSRLADGDGDGLVWG